MLCPVCRSELLVAKQERLETLPEHVENRLPTLKDSYSCSNPKCKSHEFNLRWDEFGECFGIIEARHLDSNLFVNGNSEAFSSLFRKIRAEELAKERSSKSTHIFGWVVERFCDCEADEDGNIVKQKTTINLWRPNGTLYISSLEMIVFLIRNHYRFPKLKDFEYPENDNRWWAHVVPFILRIIDKKRFEQLSRASGRI